MIDWGQEITRQHQAASAEQEQRLADKVRRQALVDAIVVQIGDLFFQGDELSQGRMLRRAETMAVDETVAWVLADNSVALVTAAQLQTAARAAVDEMGRIWIGTV
jgi:hypothetical protein